MSDAPVLVSRDGKVATVRLNRPGAMNALDGATAQALIDAMRAVGADEAVRVVVLAADGPVFTAGGDFNWVLTWPSMTKAEVDAASVLLTEAVQAIYNCPKPTIARVQGHVAGGGVGVMLACDYAIAADTAKLGTPSARNGLIAGIAIVGLLQAVGARKARQLLLHGGLLPAPEALAIGLLDKVVAPGDLDSAVATLAQELTLGAPGVQALIKRMVTHLAVAPADAAAVAYVAREVSDQCASPDAVEGMSAFLKKRKAAWTQ